MTHMDKEIREAASASRWTAFSGVVAVFCLITGQHQLATAMAMITVALAVLNAFRLHGVIKDRALANEGGAAL